MTRSTMDPTRSGSMPATVRQRSGIGNYPQPSQVGDGFELAARRLGTTRGTVKQWAYGPTNAFQRVSVILQSLVQAGQGEVAARLKAPLDAATTPHVMRDLRDLLHEEQVLDGAEDCAQLALVEALEDRAARDTYRNRLLRHRAKVDELLLALRDA